ncbi:T9SS type A sorting domain-containing protein [Belliella kenyensis]|uniref:T9SS type A sorting domain-containing protein n=1 Tax=Belliella kenyensis TaxID=1472724 RepID=A0ABV8EFJ9_9BACT|nr:T9SS type A sorting domain-containing protein [Belliella kenyensis]MCH7401876.1 T9SS type A sorting domain-containing protein [Belliella kenyensis]MDN3604376.1 T9SS type A sorting domain-containing protein [Belliella kenyensis]
MTKLKTIFIFSLILLFQSTSDLLAQFKQLGIPNPTDQNQLQNARVREDIVLNLPFWDDFSTRGIDDTKWINQGASHSYTVANSAPSIGVALLDGIGSDGQPYADSPLTQGVADRLSSHMIDLSDLTDSEKQTVFLSFYWQPAGKAEMPDANDFITLEFLNANGDWMEVWRQNGELEANRLFFTQEMVQVTESYMHESFQFRFQSRGRLSGPFDTWLIDYVYLNKNRSSQDLNRLDRALTQANTPIFNRYSSIPLFELKANPEIYLNRTGNEFKNLENRFRAMEYSVEVRNKETQTVLQRINNNTPINPVPLALERRTISSNLITSEALPEGEADLEVLTYLSTGDRSLFQLIEGDSIIFPEVNLRINDTVRTTVAVRDFLAYDDGELDYSAGINQRSGMLAVRFEKIQEAFLKGVSINFTNFRQFGRGIDIMVWTDLNQAPIYVLETVIPSKESLGDFSYFEFDENIQLPEEFYVGFMQFSNDFVYVGLDKNRDNGDQIYYNVTGSWQQNEIVEGSLMIRPHLSESAPFESGEIIPRGGIKIYPNPATEYVLIEGDFQLISIIDQYGRSINVQMEEAEKGKILNFGNQMRGIYLINVYEQGKPQSYRIIVK